MTSEIDKGGLRFRPLLGVPSISPEDDLARLLWEAAERSEIRLEDGVLVLCQKIISKAEGRLVHLDDVEPSAEATLMAEADGKDPRHMEIVLRETARIVRRGHGVTISQTHHGFVCANAGVDLSNSPGEDIAVLLPVDCDQSARDLLAGLRAMGSQRLGVVVTDTFGRPWREGLVDMAIGSAGLGPITDQRGSKDLAGRELVVTAMALVDQLAAGAGILMVKDSGIPAVFVEGLQISGDGSVRDDVLRDPATDLFR
jgi:coenzyme F420-0:L-glutamate ligase/coenzyme F420-1:gamma-L-glutamate ligase